MGSPKAHSLAVDATPVEGGVRAKLFISSRPPMAPGREGWTSGHPSWESTRTFPSKQDEPSKHKKPRRSLKTSARGMRIAGQLSPAVEAKCRGEWVRGRLPGFTARKCGASSTATPCPSCLRRSVHRTAAAARPPPDPAHLVLSQHTYLTREGRQEMGASDDYRTLPG